MKIYLYRSQFPPKGDKINSGLSKAIDGLASGLVKCGAEVTILCEASADNESCYQTPAGYVIRCFANPIQHRPSFQTSVGLKQYISQNLDSNSLVILNGILHANVYAVSRLLRKRKIPYILAPHDVYHPNMFKKNPHLKWTYWYLLEKFLLKNALAIQLLEKKQSKWLNKLGVNQKTIEVPNGTYGDDIPSESVLQWNVNKIPKIFYFGRIDSHHKGLDILLDAFAQVSQTSNVQLTIQGPDCGDQSKLEKQADQLCLKNVSFIKPEYDKSASLVIAYSDIFVLPSRFEGFGIAALEAMLAGRVLLVSQEAGIAPHVEKAGCGVVVAPEVSRIESGFLQLLKRRSEWREMGLRGRNYALEYLNWEKIASQALEDYKLLVR
ncbi:group 1 glycosyl transferase [Calothrix parasitica NIES-267]|uniref:Group 1 glycosyl transferase n=1 Tax=Calothrix parasitica NIES-267 TaxID=1973488 RepID=A0A1Z4M1C3_9CYAN|nr:group 1 glycosyl transferase [Calothrix parasitica NIES-267]